MKKVNYRIFKYFCIIAITIIFSSFNLYSNIFYINKDKIPNSQKYSAQFEYIYKNIQYINHWQPKWTFDIDKKTLVDSLKEIYRIFSKMNSKNVEINLLLGDISHYLYNLHEENYYEIAENHYQKAINSAPKDYRTYWFMGNHYALSNHQKDAIANFQKARKLLPKNEPAEFWDEFTFAAATANMPSHSIYSMEKSKKIAGRPGDFELQLGKTIRERLIPANSDSTYVNTDLWSGQIEDLISFISRPLGIKIMIDSSWEVEVYDYKDHKAGFTVKPPSITNNKGDLIAYSIAVIMKVAESGDSLSGIMNQVSSKFPVKYPSKILNKYPEMLSYEMKDMQVYKDYGGGHFNIIVVKRDKPDFPGLLLEEAVPIPEPGAELSFYNPGKSLTRFDGAIYYTFILDTCEDIYPESLKIFKKLLDNQIVIE